MDFLRDNAALLGAIAAVIVIASAVMVAGRYIAAGARRAWGFVVRVLRAAEPFLPRVSPPDRSLFQQSSDEGFVEQTARFLENARSSSAPSPFVGQLEMYCGNSSCVVREVGISVTEFDGKTPPRLPCPVCGRALKPHSVRSHNRPA